MKYRICSRCNHKNVSFRDKCEECGNELKNETVYEKPSPPPETIQGYFFKRLLISIAVLGVVALVSFVLTLLGIL